MIVLIGICILLTLCQSQSCSKEDKVLFFGDSMIRRQSKMYTNVVTNLGYSYDVISGSDWSNMVQTDFAKYRAIVFVDAIDDGTGYITGGVNTYDQWSPVIDGNMLIIGTDELHHNTSGGFYLIENGLEFVLDDTCDKTGLYVSLSYYYYPIHGMAYSLPVDVELLQYWGSFNVDHTDEDTETCHDDAHIVASHPVLNGLSDNDLSNWGCSVHEIFLDYPDNFIPLAIAQDVNGYATGSLGTIYYQDGSYGVPYILVNNNNPPDNVIGDPLLECTSPISDNNICNNTPCSCDEINNCNTCNDGSGCNQCQTGYFKLNDNYQCINCNEYLGDGCMFCQDYNGCGQCKNGYTKVYNPVCEYFVCESNYTPTPTKIQVPTTTQEEDDDAVPTTTQEEEDSVVPTTTQEEDDICDNFITCDNNPCSCEELVECQGCHSNGCDQCNNGHFKKDYNYPCLNCQNIFSDNCIFCQDYTGCGQCKDGCTREYNSNCGVYECINCPCDEKIYVTNIIKAYGDPDPSYDFTQYYGTYYYSGLSDDYGYPYYEHDSSEAIFYVRTFWTSTDYWIDFRSNYGFWLFLDGQLSLNSDGTFQIQNDNNPFDGKNEDGWSTRGNWGINITATFDDCTGVGLEV